VIGGLRIREKLFTITAPQLPTIEASADAGIIDFWIVLAVARVRAATLWAFTDHDSIDELLASRTLLECIAKSVHYFGTHACQHA
jgi:hypothetical protein